MRKLFLLFSSLFIITNLFGQVDCLKNHVLFQIPVGRTPENVSKLGEGPQFIPLRRITDKARFYKVLRTKASWNRYKSDYAELGRLLEAIGFAGGVSSTDLTPDRVEKLDLPYGIEGNLGGKKKKQTFYLYGKILDPEYRNTALIPAWKITSPTGCFFYIFVKCGNAFYFKDTTDSCCRNVTVTSRADTLRLVPQTVTSTKRVRICFHKICVSAVGRTGKGGQVQRRTGTGRSRRTDSDTTLLMCKDTSFSYTYQAGAEYRVWMEPYSGTFTICSDTAIAINSRLGNTLIPVSISQDPQKVDILDFYITEPCYPCGRKWELGLDAGTAFSTVPNVNDTIHTRASRGRFTGNIYLGYNLSENVQVGISVSSFTLAYRDDRIYTRPPGSYGLYNEVFLARPAIPVQIFGKLMFGTQRLRTNVSLSAGYAFATGDGVYNNGNRMSFDLNTSGGFTSMLGLGVDYWVRQCKWCIGGAIKAAYFSIKGDEQKYNLFSFPVTIGVRFRL